MVHGATTTKAKMNQTSDADEPRSVPVEFPGATERAPRAYFGLAIATLFMAPILGLIAVHQSRKSRDTFRLWGDREGARRQARWVLVWFSVASALTAVVLGIGAVQLGAGGHDRSDDNSEPPKAYSTHLAGENATVEAVVRVQVQPGGGTYTVSGELGETEFESNYHVTESSERTFLFDKGSLLHVSVRPADSQGRPHCEIEIDAHLVSSDTGLLAFCSTLDADVPDFAKSAANEFEVGDCLIVGEDVDTVTAPLAVDCSKAHDSEVIYTYALPTEATYSTKTDSVLATCEPVFESLLGALEQSNYDLGYLYPTPPGWARGDRTIACYAYGSESHTGSLLNHTPQPAKNRSRGPATR
jgi:Septum formation